ncbi:MAG: hypothetical protein L5655_09425 [Thermosediminibacteraceae bacterium]|nr:hypothetical protein [Thermosediminibacteraceae bacterium]
MRAFLVSNLSPTISGSVDMTFRAFVCKKVENGYIIEINGEKIFARTDLWFKEGNIITLKPVRFFENKVVFKVLERHDRVSEGTQQATPALNDVLPVTILSKLNIPITPNRLKILTRIIEKLLENIDHAGKHSILPEQTHSHIHERILNSSAENDKDISRGEAAEPTSFAQIASRVLNAAYADLKDTKVEFFAFNHPLYGNILLKVKRQEREQDKPLITLSFLVNTSNLGRILVSLSYSKGIIGGSLIFEDQEKLDIARKRYEKIKENSTFPRLIESLNWQFRKISADKFLLEDLNPGINSGVDVTV